MCFQSSRVQIIEKQTESQERLASQLEEKIRAFERVGEAQQGLQQQVGCRLSVLSEKAALLPADSSLPQSGENFLASLKKCGCAG